MKKQILSVMLAATVALTPIAGALPVYAAAYTDTAGSFAESSIDRWSEEGIVYGTGNGKFSPSADLTRGECAAIFSRLLKLTKKADISNLKDVSKNAFYYDSIAECVEAGILKGVSSTKMNPDGELTREQLFAMTARALEIPEETTLAKEMDDVGKVSDWAKGSVYALINRGIIKGTTDTTISPMVDIDRQSVMAILDRAIVGYGNKDGETVTTDKDGIVLVVADNVTVKASSDVDVIVAKEGVTVSLQGSTGDVDVTAIQNDVTVTNAAAGTTVSAAKDVTGTKVNGTAVAKGTSYTVPRTTAGGGGSSTSGTSTPAPNPGTSVPGGGSDTQTSKSDDAHTSSGQGSNTNTSTSEAGGATSEGSSEITTDN